MGTILNIIRKVRAFLFKLIWPKGSYMLFAPKPIRALYPISRKFGYDRGTPVDRYYIEKFMEQNRALVKGRCLEIHDDAYIKRYGGANVTHADVLDIEQGNKLANIYGDLRNLPQVQDNTYDTIILTQTLGMIDDYEAAVRECIRILKPGGALLVTVSHVSPILDDESGCFRFTPKGLRFTFSKHKSLKDIDCHGYGNVLSAQAYWVGLAQEELTKEELEHDDPSYPLIVGLKAIKA